MTRNLLLVILLVISGKSFGVYVGVIEESYTHGNSKLQVRMLFSGQNNRWVSINTIEKAKKYGKKQMVWYLSFDGHLLGTIQTIDENYKNIFEYPWTFARDKHLTITNVNSAPRIKNNEERFVGWSFTPKYRPIVLVSQKNYIDPDVWKRVKNEDIEYSRYIPLLKKEFKRARTCGEPPDYIGQDININYGSTEIFRSYKNKNGDTLIEIGIKSTLLKNCEFPYLVDMSPIWIYQHGKEIKIIGKNIDLIDAGDYDADGAVEFMFWYSGYNKDGYILYESDFNSRTEYLWKYH